MNTRLDSEIQVQGKINSFFDRFRIGSLLHQCGIRKRHGHSVRFLIETLFTLAFVGTNFYRGIVTNEEIPFGKDAAYELLKNPGYNWRRLVLTLAVKLFLIFNRLTDEQRESVLILDDSIYDRSRSKKVELLCNVFDHCEKRYLKGFRMLTLSWSDGTSCLPLDFALLSSSDAKKRICESQKQLDKRCCAYKRRKEATEKATFHLPEMVKRALSAGIEARYLVMDSWFTMPANVIALREHVDVIGMVKKTPKIHYGFQGLDLDLMAIYRRLKKRPGRAKILASTLVTLKDGKSVKLVFVRDRRKKDWLALLSTNTELANEEVVRIYGKRWDIEVFFKMAKQHLKLAKEIQCRDYDALIAHTSIVFMRYMFIAYHVRLETDQRTFGDLFYACCEEMQDISFIEALYRIMTLAVVQLREVGSYCEKTANAFFDTVLSTALASLGLSKNNITSISGVTV